MNSKFMKIRWYHRLFLWAFPSVVCFYDGYFCVEKKAFGRLFIIKYGEWFRDSKIKPQTEPKAGSMVDVDYNCTLARLCEQVGIKLWQGMVVMKWAEFRFDVKLNYAAIKQHLTKEDV